MIALLKGIIEDKGPDWAIIDVGGVGYRVACSAKTLDALPAHGEPAVLHTEMLVSENAIRLVGFATRAEREWYGLLDQVQGVGTKVALAILSTLSPKELESAIAYGDKAMVSRAPGVGPKVATRIVSELKDKAPALALASAEFSPAAGGAEEAEVRSAGRDAISALVNLGYGRAQAGAAVASALTKSGGEASTEELIRQGLKELAS
ncbi:MAG: Holliday junction branch migration protein RuvA [Rhodobiaceae bacterium]|nr:Holliday junction branch migration protein RuvA [Rhodobiaceae bacterium]MCC0057261.1 Holliday junction branch migration protein RuvA [Rhodobiaceae bacterium]